MTNALNLIHTDLFHGSPVNIYENASNEIFMTARQLATCLEYSRKSQFEKLLSHHPELRENEFSLLATIPVPQTIPPSKGSTHSQQIFIDQQTRVFNEDGIYEVCMLSRKPKAQEFRRHIRQILKSLRRGEMQLVATQPVQALALQAQLTAMMNSISELKADLKHQSSSLQRIVGAVCTYHSSPWKTTVYRRVKALAEEINCTDNKQIFANIYNSMRDTYGKDLNVYADIYAQHHPEDKRLNGIDTVDAFEELQPLFDTLLNNYVNLFVN